MWQDAFDGWATPPPEEFLGALKIVGMYLLDNTKQDLLISRIIGVFSVTSFVHTQFDCMQNSKEHGNEYQDSLLTYTWTLLF